MGMCARGSEAKKGDGDIFSNFGDLRLNLCKKVTSQKLFR
jgi:hypothetical protein